MKSKIKIGIFSLALALILTFFGIHANAKSILTLNASIENGVISVNGTAENGTLAVAIMVYDGEDLVAMETVSVDNNNSFEAAIDVPNGNYTIKVADYDGGNFQTTQVETNEPIMYTVTFKDGDTILSTKKVNSGSVVSAPSNPIKNSYSFNCWLLNGSVYDFSTPVTGNIVLTADWTYNAPTVTKYTVSFNSDGGSIIASQKVESGKTVSAPNNPTKDGYEFVAWTLNGSTYSFSTKVTSDITLIATWKKIEEVEPTEPDTPVTPVEPENPSINPEDPTTPIVPVAPDIEENTEELEKEVTEIVEQIIKDEQIPEMPEELKEVIKEAVKNDKKVTTDLVADKVSDKEVTKEVKEQVEKTVSNATKVLGYYDINIIVKVDDIEVGNITKLNTPITLTIDTKDIIDELPKVEEGFNRVYKIIYIHNGVVKVKEATLNSDNTLSFEADEFSNYIVTYEDVKIASNTSNNSNIPKTGDNIISYVVLLSVSCVGLISTFVYIKKKSNNN